MQQHLETIQSIYQAFGRRDVPAILKHLAPDVRWNHWIDNSAQRAGYALLQARTGHAGATDFFRLLGSDYSFHEFKVIDIVAGDSQVVAEIDLDMTYLPTGRRLRDEALHLWTFGADGLICRYRPYFDTAKHMEAAGVLAAA